MSFSLDDRTRLSGVGLILHIYHYIGIGFGRVRCDSTPRFVRPSVCPSVHPSVTFYLMIFSRGHATLHLAVSVGRLVRW